MCVCVCVVSHQAASGVAWLSDPQHLLPSAPGSETTPDIAAGVLMAVVDALQARSAAGIPDAPPDAPAAADVKSVKGKKASKEPEECFRYQESSVVNGWGMGTPDAVTFKVCVFVLLVCARTCRAIPWWTSVFALLCL